MKLTFLGTGTSYGVPYVACPCAVCTSTDPHNKRLRSSVLVEGDATDETGRTTRLLIDTTPDIRQQLLRAGVDRLSAVFWTHRHNDHVIGLDDIRPLSDRQGYIDGYAGEDTWERLHHVFDYVFLQERERGGFPRMTPHVVHPYDSVTLGDLHVTAIPIWHYQREIFAYRFDCAGRSIVYATDCSAIPETSEPAMREVDIFIVDALRHQSHVAHFTVEQALAAVARLNPGRAYFTHIAHDLDHADTNAALPAGVELAYDGLVLAL